MTQTGIRISVSLTSDSSHLTTNELILYSAWPLFGQPHGGFLLEHLHGGFALNAVNAIGSAGAVIPQPVATAAPKTPQQTLEEPTRVRSVFPETWLWSSAITGYLKYMVSMCLTSCQNLGFTCAHESLIKRETGKSLNVLCN